MTGTLLAFLLAWANVLFFVVIGGAVNYFVGPPIDASDFPYKQTALATAAYFLVYNLAIFYQSMMGLQVWEEAKKKKDDEKISLWEIKYGPYCYKDKRIVAGNRIAANTLEQMVGFLAGLWLTALLTNDQHASRVGWVYVVFRAMYPLFYVSNPALVLVATLPNYCTVCYLWITVVRACLV